MERRKKMMSVGYTFFFLFLKQQSPPHNSFKLAQTDRQLFLPWFDVFYSDIGANNHWQQHSFRILAQKSHKCCVFPWVYTQKNVLINNLPLYSSFGSESDIQMSPRHNGHTLSIIKHKQINLHTYIFSLSHVKKLPTSLIYYTTAWKIKACIV